MRVTLQNQLNLNIQFCECNPKNLANVVHIAM